LKKIIYKDFKLLKSNHIIIECKVNNVKGKFVLDTGASNSCINYLSTDKFNINFMISKEKASSATNQINQTFYSKDNLLKIGDLEKNNFDVFLFDMTYINDSLKEKGINELDGIIGSDVLKEFNANINYKKKVLSLEF
jgi:predicted aspartyl protease